MDSDDLLHRAARLIDDTRSLRANLRRHMLRARVTAVRTSEARHSASHETERAFDLLNRMQRGAVVPDEK